MTYYGTDFNPAIVGRRLTAVEVSEDKSTLTLCYTDGTESHYRAMGDCCSESWIEHITVPADIDGASITGVSQSGYVSGRRATPEEYAKTEAERQYVDSLEVYHSAIQTDRGEVIVEYRNDSNGYYGGWLEQVADGVRS